MIKVLLVDDERSALANLKELLSSYKNLKICGEALNVEEATDLTCKEKPDVIFLDIILGEKTGFDFLNNFLPKTDFKIIFTTAYNEFAIKAFEFSALDYLLKPLESHQLEKSISKINSLIDNHLYIKRLENLVQSLENDEHQFIFVKLLEGVYKLKISELLYLEASGNYTTIYSKKAKQLTSAKTLAFYNKQLNELSFIRVHHKYLVNYAMINSYDKRKKEITLINKKKIPISIRKEKQFLEVWCKRK